MNTRDGSIAYLADACGRDVRIEVREADDAVVRVVDIR